jgi:hypothetical protein
LAAQKKQDIFFVVDVVVAVQSDYHCREGGGGHGGQPQRVRCH